MPWLGWLHHAMGLWRSKPGKAPEKHTKTAQTGHLTKLYIAVGSLWRLPDSSWSEFRRKWQCGLLCPVVL